MWFSEEVLAHRFAFSWMWMMVLQVLAIDGFHFFIKVLTWHPLLGFQDWLTTVTSMRAVYFHMLLLFSCTTFTLLHMRYYSVQRYVYSNRLEMIWTSISPHRVFHLICHAVLGSINAFCFLQYIGGIVNDPDNFESIFTWRSWPEYCFVLFHGLYTGATFSRKYFGKDWYYITFHLDKKRRLPFTNTDVFPTFKMSAENSVDSFPMYYLYYISLGWLCMDKIYTSLGLEIETSLSTTLYTLLSVNLLLAVVISATMMYFTWFLYLEVFEMFATERYEFYIDTKTEAEKSKILSKALTCSDFKLLQYLAFLDLRWLSQYSPDRRKRFFSISQPGGHPHQWHSLSCICMTSLSQFLNNLKTLSVLERKNEMDSHSKNADQANLQNPMLAIAEKVQGYFKQKPLFKYFFADFPDTEALKLFTACQLEIWTIESLGYFISNSYKEDNYGVVQQTLPKILCLLIDLKACEEKLPLGIMSFKKYSKDSKFLHKGVSQRNLLKAALESTLYKIVFTFQKDIKGIFIPEEYHRYLEKYLKIKK